MGMIFCFKNPFFPSFSPPLNQLPDVLEFDNYMKEVSWSFPRDTGTCPPRRHQPPSRDANDSKVSSPWGFVTRASGGGGTTNEWTNETTTMAEGGWCFCWWNGWREVCFKIYDLVEFDELHVACVVIKQITSNVCFRFGCGAFWGGEFWGGLQLRLIDEMKNWFWWQIGALQLHSIMEIVGINFAYSCFP